MTKYSPIRAVVLQSNLWRCDECKLQYRTARVKVVYPSENWRENSFLCSDCAAADPEVVLALLRRKG